MTENDNVVRTVSWRDLCPWLIIFRAFGLAVSPGILILAFMGALLTPAGWWLSSKVFLDPETTESATSAIPSEVESIAAYNATCPCAPTPGGLANHFYLPETWQMHFIAPFWQLFNPEINLSGFACMLFGGLWTILVWGFFGAAISRIAVMQLGREERIGIREASSHACKKYLAYIAGPLLPLLAVAVIALPAAILGLFMMANVGVLLASLVWPLVLLSSFVMAIILLGLAFGWPLMWSTVSAEGTDAFDGLSRSYAYTFQRPLHYLFYGAVLIGFGIICWVLVQYFADSVIRLSYWSTSWGTSWVEGVEDGVRRIEDIKLAVDGDNKATDSDGKEVVRVTLFGPSLIYFFQAIIYGIASAFSYSYFWCGFAAIYLMLRLNVDQTEFDEVWIEDDEEQYGLPPVKPDAAGVPDLADEKPSEQESDEKEASAESDAPATVEYEPSPSDRAEEDESTSAEEPSDDTEPESDSQADDEASSSDESESSDDEDDNEKLEADS